MDAFLLYWIRGYWIRGYWIRGACEIRSWAGIAGARASQTRVTAAERPIPGGPRISLEGSRSPLLGKGRSIRGRLGCFVKVSRRTTYLGSPKTRGAGWGNYSSGSRLSKSNNPSRFPNYLKIRIFLIAPVLIGGGDGGKRGGCRQKLPISDRGGCHNRNWIANHL